MDVLYNFFQWAKLENSRLVLIGIANALDLTCRFLPRLKTKGFEPEYLSFAPYKVDEITAIIKDRLEGLDPGTPLTPSAPNTASNGGGNDTPSKKIMQPMAIELAARKLAGTGDLRKALDVCRQAFTLVEAEGNEQVTIKHILKASNSMFGNKSQSSLETLNVHQKILLTMLAMQSSSKVKEIQVFDFYTRYRTANVRKYKIDCLNMDRFQEILGTLEASALVRVFSKKGRKMACLNLSPEQVFSAMQDSPTIQNFISQGKC